MKDETFSPNEDVPASGYIDDEYCARYRRDAESGDAEAQFKLSDYCLTNFDMDESANSSESLKWLRNAAEQGYSPAQFRLGYMYMVGLRLSMDHTQALNWLHKADETGGDHDAQFCISLMYLRGTGVPKDDTLRVAWLRKAADGGHAEAQYYLGSMYDRGLGGLPKDGTKAAALYLESAKQEHPYAEFTLGLLHEYGRGVPKNKDEAIKWYRRAAEHGEEAAHEKLREIGVES